MQKQYKLVRNPISKDGIYQRVRKEDAGWDHLSMEAMTIGQGSIWEGDTEDNEYAIVLLAGNFSVTSDKGKWATVNGRKSVFDGIAHTLYLPRHTSFKLTSESEIVDIALGWCRAKDDFPARLKTPDQAAVEIRGGDNATRQINSLIEPGFPCSNIVAVEVYTPAGNWSSYPAHKHDERILDENGIVQEAKLEEIYFYKIKGDNGYAIQHVYTKDNSLNELMQVHNNDAVMVPKGYHPVVAAPGYDCYYLNFLAGSDQSLANTPDPDHKWYFNSWNGQDARIPLVTASMNK